MTLVSIKTLAILEIISCANNNLRGKTRLQKLAFLAQEDDNAKLDYDFEPAPLGPLSEDVNYQIMKLREFELVKEIIEQTASGNKVFCYQLTDIGREILHSTKKITEFKTTEKIIKNIYKKYGNMSYVELLEFIHTNYPQYHIKGIL